MQQQECVALRVFINRFHKGSPQALMRYLPESDAQQLQNCNIISDDASPLTESIRDKLKHIHYSWLVAAVEKLPRILLEPAIESLTPSQTRGLQHLLHVQPLPQRPAPPMREKLLSLIWKELRIAELSPLAYLPKTEFTELADWNKSALILLIDLISTYDIADKIRMIVDKKRLQQIMNALSPQQQRFLKIAMSSKSRSMRRSFDLERFKGSSEELARLLHVRGIITLALALSGQSQTLLWNLSHRLDTGRGDILEKNFSSSPVAGITGPLSQQVLSAMNFISKRES